MIRRLVLAALAEGIVVGNDDAAREAIARTEWLLRRRARRRLEDALVDAALAANEPNAFHDVEAARHVQRVAALAVARVDVDPRDRTRVAELYAARRPVRARRVPLALILTLVFAVAAAAGVVVVVRGLRGAPEYNGRVVDSYVRPKPPVVAGAFASGGTPVGDPAIEAVLVGDFTDFIVAIDRDRRAGGNARAAHLAKLRESPAIAAKGPALVTAWTEMLELLDRFAAGALLGEVDLDAIGVEVRHEVQDVSDQLAAAGIGLYLEGYVRSSSKSSSVIVYTYRVEEVVFVRAGMRRQRVLSLRRLDQLNRSWALLGMRSEDLGDPVLLLDKIDEHVATTVLPVLVHDAPYPLATGERERNGPDLEVLAAAVGRAVREELVAAYGVDAARAGGVARLLAERKLVVDGWRAHLERVGIRLARLETLYLPETLFDQIGPRIPPADLDRGRAIENELAALEAGRIAARAYDLMVATVRRHEAQHGLDAERELPRYPDALAAIVDPAAGRSAQRARSELSAYLSQIASDPTTPQLSLWHVGRAVFDRGGGGAEWVAGVVIIEGLARKLRIAAPAGGEHDSAAMTRRRLLAPALALAKTPSVQIRQAARELWRELYDEDFEPVVDR